MSSRAGVNYVFLKVKGKRDARPKRILLPTSLVALKKAAAKAIDDARPIASITAENGETITDIRDISPNQILCVVFEAASSVKDKSSSADIPKENKAGNLAIQSSEETIKSVDSKTQIALTPKSGKGKGATAQSKTPAGSAKGPPLSHKSGAGDTRSQTPKNLESKIPQSKHPESKTPTATPGKSTPRKSSLSGKSAAGDARSQASKASESRASTATPGKSTPRKPSLSGKSGAGDIRSQSSKDLESNIPELKVPQSKVLMVSSGKSTPRRSSVSSKSAASNARSQTPRDLESNAPELKVPQSRVSAATSGKSTPRRVNELDFSTDYSDDHDKSDSSSESDNYQFEDLDRTGGSQQGEQLMSSVIPIKKMRNHVVKAFLDLNPDTQDFLSQAFTIEHSQQERYVASIFATLKQNDMFSLESEKIEGAKELRDKARRMVSSHRVVRPNGISYCFKTAIVGPSNSGKSTFLKILIRELLVDLVATDNWKRTFVFPVDMSLIMDADPAVIFGKWVSYTFAQLRAQTPSMLEYLPGIERSFMGLMETKGTAILPKKFTQILEYRKLSAEIQRILSNMAAIWYDTTSLLPWWASIAMLPFLLARALGFKNIIMISDHFDETSVEIQPCYPFEGSPHVAFLSEIWKCALEHGSCILGARDTGQFMRLMDSLDDFSFDFSNYIDYETVYNIIRTPKFSDKEIVVEFNETNELLKIYAWHCAGIPNYLLRWYELNIEFDEMEAMDPKTDDYEEKMCHVITRVENLLELIYVPTEDETEPSDPLAKLSVADGRRRVVYK